MRKKVKKTVKAANNTVEKNLQAQLSFNEGVTNSNDLNESQYTYMTEQTVNEDNSYLGDHSASAAAQVNKEIQDKEPKGNLDSARGAYGSSGDLKVLSDIQVQSPANIKSTATPDGKKKDADQLENNVADPIGASVPIILEEVEEQKVEEQKQHVATPRDDPVIEEKKIEEKPAIVETPAVVETPESPKATVAEATVAPVAPVVEERAAVQEQKPESQQQQQLPVSEPVVVKDEVSKDVVVVKPEPQVEEKKVIVEEAAQIEQTTAQPVKNDDVVKVEEEVKQEPLQLEVAPEQIDAVKLEDTVKVTEESTPATTRANQPTESVEIEEQKQGEVEQPTKESDEEQIVANTKDQQYLMDQEAEFGTQPTMKSSHRSDIVSSARPIVILSENEEDLPEEDLHKEDKSIVKELPETAQSSQRTEVQEQKQATSIETEAAPAEPTQVEEPTEQQTSAPIEEPKLEETIEEPKQEVQTEVVVQVVVEEPIEKPVEPVIEEEEEKEQPAEQQQEVRQTVQIDTTASAITISAQDDEKSNQQERQEFTKASEYVKPNVPKIDMKKVPQTSTPEDEGTSKIYIIGAAAAGLILAGAYMFFKRR